MTTAASLSHQASTMRDEPPLALHNGDRMTQAEFHRISEQMPAGFRAELIGGEVHVAASLVTDHAEEHVALAGLLFIYRSRTPGVQALDNATVILGDSSEPQPDLTMRVRPEFGGRTQTVPGAHGQRFVQGAPELLIEIAHSSRAIDLHRKRDDYADHGVLEYLVYLIEVRRFAWFDLPNDLALHPDADGVIRSRQFPGLWIDSVALAARDDMRLVSTLEAGLASPGHAEFVRLLADRRPGV